MTTRPTFDREDARVLASIRTRTTAPGRFVMAAAALVGSLFAVSQVRAALDDARAREALLSVQRAEVARLTPQQASFSSRFADMTTSLAQRDWQGDLVSPRLSANGGAAVLSEQGVYLRLTQPRAINEKEVHEAAKESRKDAFSLCFLGQAGKREQALDDAQRCADGSCVGARTSRLHNLHLVHRGLDALTPAFEQQARVTSQPYLRFMADDLNERLQLVTPLARDVVDHAAYALVVVDEIPQGAALPYDSPAEETLQTIDHPVRIGLFDARSGEPLARLRLDASTPPSLPASLPPAAQRQAQNCSLGLEARARLSP